jgi:CubicO group peptidase (beta-lactamase class C family)
MKTNILLSSLFFLLVASHAQRPPIAGLPAISLEEAGLNNDSINALIPIMDNFKQADFRGLVVLKDNQAVIEWYYNTFGRTSILDVRSAGKGITSLLLGVAMQEGLVESLEQDVYSFFPKEKYPNVHEDFKRIKIKHLLDMASGLDADSDDFDTPGNVGHFIRMDNWKEYILSIPLANTPGEKWVYADINAILVGAIIEEQSGMSLRDFAKKYVFNPLGIQQYYWFTNASNQTGAAGNLYLSTLDFAKLGVLVANKGKWGEQQIVKAEYIERLIEHKDYDTTDWWPLSEQYGMFWFKQKGHSATAKLNFFLLQGLGGTIS